MEQDDRFDRRFVQNVAERLRAQLTAGDFMPPDFPDYPGMLDSFHEAEGEPYLAAATAISWWSFRSTQSLFLYAVQFVESPIEKYMLLGLTLASFEDVAGIVTLVIQGKHHVVGERPAMREMYIQPQAQIGDYRVDFLLTHVGTDWRARNDEAGSLAKWQAKAHLVVECDGYEYHRTKEQMKRDNERDRWLQSLGYPVFRFSGTEIWEDPMQCAAKCAWFVHNQVTEKLKQQFDTTEDEETEDIPF
jgi:very-short-patch-repair endonuclease